MPTLTCIRCGLTWHRLLMLDVPCPVCRAAPGRICRRPSEHNLWDPVQGKVHFARDTAALEAGAMTSCPPSRNPGDHRDATRAAREAHGFKDPGRYSVVVVPAYTTPEGPAPAPAPPSPEPTVTLDSFD